MQWLVRGAQPNDSLFFHCKHLYCDSLQLSEVSVIDSGHGGQTKDLDGDEDDGFDEGILNLRPFAISLIDYNATQSFTL